MDIDRTLIALSCGLAVYVFLGGRGGLAAGLLTGMLAWHYSDMALLLSVPALAMLVYGKWFRGDEPAPAFVSGPKLGPNLNAEVIDAEYEVVR